MARGLFLFSIGPVQSFITQARKTQDLYAGSYILSYLTKVAAESVKRKFDAEIVFPDLASPSLPNRFLAKIPSINDYAIIGQETEKLIRQEFKQMAEHILTRLHLRKPFLFDAQIKRFLTVNWVCLPLEDYVSGYSQIEQTLGTVKQVRHFEQINETGRKCNLSGENNVVFYRGIPKKYVDVRSATAIPESMPLKWLADGEGLDAVSFTKRCCEVYFADQGFDYTADFPSTAQVALMASLNRLPSNILQSYTRLFSPPLDYHVFYEENLTEKNIRLYSPVVSQGEAIRQLGRLKKELQKRKARLTKYYAVLKMDGDDMGRWLSGEWLTDTGALPDFHRRLTAGLSDFTDRVRKIVHEPRGRLVFCGGEDVLALLNLNYLPAVLQEIRQAYPNFQNYGPVAASRHASISGGLCIAHYKTPLTEVLNWTSRLEKEAKNPLGTKNAIAIGVIKHTGEIHKTVLKWRNDEGFELMPFIKELVDALVTNRFSATFIQSIQQAFRPLLDAKGNFFDSTLFLAELKRLFARSCQHSQQRLNKQEEAAIFSRLEDLFYHCGNLEEFFSTFNIVRFLAREVNEQND